MSDFGVMKTRIAGELMAGGRSDLDTQVGDAIRTAIAHYRAQPFWFNRGVESSSTAVGVNALTIPASIIAVTALRIDDGSGFFEMRKEPFDRIRRLRSGSQSNGRPYRWAEYEDQIQVWQTPDAVYPLEWYGVKHLTALSASSDTNAWMTHGEELIRQRARAIVQIDVLKDADARAEMAQVQMAGGPGRFCLSLMERAALKALKIENTRRSAHDRVRPG